MVLKNLKINKLLNLIEKRPWIIFIALAASIFFSFSELFNSYFIADEWFHFTYYLPLTRQPDGFLTAIISTVINSGPLSAGQHVVPIASAIYFLNTKFFGLNYAPYAFMTILLHAVNSFLVFLFVKSLLHQSSKDIKNVFAVMAAIFFAFAPAHLHAVTGAAPFYGQNVLSVTFFLLCVISFKTAFNTGARKFIYASIVFLFLSLFTKETSVFLFMLLPLMVIFEKRIFPLKFLARLFILCVIVYAIFRFLVPNIYQGAGPLIDKLVDTYILKEYKNTNSDTGTIVSTDLSVHKNLPAEIAFRAITFPIKMTGTLFLPREVTLAIVQLITPIVYPLSAFGVSAEESSAVVGFVYGPGNGFVLYFVSIIILVSCVFLVIQNVKKKKIYEGKAIATALAIIILSALPLVAIIFSFPRWGYDTYFDSRFYYNPSVGAAILFPFLLVGLAKAVCSLFKIRSVSFVAFALFIAWLVLNLNSFKYNFNAIVNRYGSDSRMLVEQLNEYLPTLPKKAVFYTETDGLSAYGPSLPFQTGVPQALTVIYYDRSPLPDVFFEKPILDGKGEGYQYSEGQGFGYYTSKKTLSSALKDNKFKTSDIYAYYYKAEKVQLLDITKKVRAEMDQYLAEAKNNSEWKVFQDPLVSVLFSYPPQTIVEQDSQSTIKTLILNNPNFTATMSIFNISAGFNIEEFVAIRGRNKLAVANLKKVSYDRFHYNDAYVISNDSFREYLIKFDDKLIQLETQNLNQDSILLIEKILGSLEVSK